MARLWGGYGAAPMRLWGDYRPISRNGPGGWRWVWGQRLAFWGSQPGLDNSNAKPELRPPAWAALSSLELK